MSSKEQEIFSIIKEYVWNKKQIKITKETELYSMGILDSLDMFGMIMELESKGFKLNFLNKEIKSNIDYIDTTQKIIELII